MLLWWTSLGDERDIYEVMLTLQVREVINPAEIKGKVTRWHMVPSLHYTMELEMNEALVFYTTDYGTFAQLVHEYMSLIGISTKLFFSKYLR